MSKDASTSAMMGSLSNPSAADWLYPEIEPYRHGYLRVSENHELYFEECGNPDGVAAVVLHGGPGAATGPEARRFFDPKGYRIILFDQRGCGRSRPHGSLKDNTTWALVNDIERLREHLGVKRWLVFGGSWGSTLSLAYAESYPNVVAALVLRGIFLGSKWEIDRLYRNPSGAGQMFPEEWEAFEGHIPPDERKDLVAAYFRRLTDEDANVRAAAALCWSKWEGSASHLIPNTKTIARFAAPDFAAAVAAIECHYFMNSTFLRPNQLLDAIDRIRHIPSTIIHGRYDAICPLSVAWLLHRKWPEATFRIVPDAGHSALEPGTARELVSATDKYKDS